MLTKTFLPGVIAISAGLSLLTGCMPSDQSPAEQADRHTEQNTANPVFLPQSTGLIVDLRFTCPAPDAGLIEIDPPRYGQMASLFYALPRQGQRPVTLRIFGANGERIEQLELPDQTISLALDGGCPDFVIPHSGESGIWRFTLNKFAWKRLIEHYQMLSPGEQLSLVQSALSAYARGQLEENVLRDMIEVTLAGSPASAILILDHLRHYYASLTESENKSRLRAYIEDMYGERGRVMDLQSDEGLSQAEALYKETLRSTLLSLDLLEDRQISYLEIARAYIGSDTGADPSALSKQALSDVIRLGLIEDKTVFFKAALFHAQGSADTQERTHILQALARHGQESDVLALMEAVLDEPFTGSEAWSASLAALNNFKAQNAIWQRFKGNFETLISRIPSDQRAEAALAVKAFCRPDQIRAAADFILDHSDKMKNFEPYLISSVDHAGICASFNRLELTRTSTR